jgi:F-type H+-transporting ATPase subunit epsilon
MAVEKLRLRVATPDNVKYDQDAEMVIMRCITGDMGILPRHESCSAILDYGVLRILNDGDERRMAVFGGIAQIRDNVLTILANDAQWPEDIDITHAEAERDRAARLLQEGPEDLNIQREQVKMRRSLVQIEVSSYPLMSKIDSQ